MFQLSRFVREIPVSVMGLLYCRVNTKSPGEIKLLNLYYYIDIVIIFIFKNININNGDYRSLITE